MEMEIEKYTAAVRKRHFEAAKPLVVNKIQNMLEEEGFFDGRYWTFSWDNNLHPINNIMRCSAELRVLRILEAEKAITISTKETPDINRYGNRPYRKQYEYKTSDSGRITPESDEAGKHFHTAVWLTSFDVDRFRQYAESIGIKIAGANLGLINETQSISIRSYDPDLGTLYFIGKNIQIICQKSRIGRKTVETTQGRAMRLLFKDVNNLRTGVPLHTIISVRKDNFDKTKRKRVINHLDEINRKIKEVTDVSKLIIHDQVNYYINKSYLETG